ncbi:MAG: nucleoside 2-deoxyribosyltransferase domain-containing protein [Chloroflexales bacterium]
MEYIEALTDYHPSATGRSLFLAGGITGCLDWQALVCQQLADTDLVLLNPRRVAFPMHDPAAAEQQITWEYRHLRRATAVLFWFPSETLCPITLYELGAWSMTTKPLFVGVHPAYQRRQDVAIQSRLARPAIQVVASLEALIAQVRHFADS